MKKNLLPFALVPAMLLAACAPTTDITSSGSTGSDSSESASQSSSDSSSLPSSEEKLTAAMVFDTLLEAAKGNYTINYSHSGKDYSDVYTSSYVYFGTSESGAIALPSYLDETKTLLYQYAVENGTVEIGGALYSIDDNGAHIPATSIVDAYDYLSLMADQSYAITALAFKEQDGGVYSENMYVCAILGAALGYAQAAQYAVFDRVDFSIDGGNLVCTLSLSEGYENEIPEDELTFSISSIGTSKVEVLDQYICGVSLPKETITADMLSPISGSQVHVRTTISRVEGNASSVAATMDYSFDDDHMHTVLTSASGAVDEQLLVKAKEDGDSIVAGDATIERLNGENDVIFLPTQRQWSTYDFPSEFIDDIMKATRKTEEGTYHYYGYEGEDFVSSLMRVFITDGSMDISSMDFHLKDGKLSEIDVTFLDSPNAAGTAYFHYEAKIEVLPFEAIEEIKPYEPISGVTEKIQASFDYLKQEGVSYETDGYLVSDKEANPDGYDGQKVIVTPDAVLIEDRNPLQHTVYGYKKDGDKVIPFEVTENGDGTKNVRAIGEAVEGSVYDYVPFTASANVFDINDDGQYVLRPNIVYINKAIFCGAYGRLIDPNTLTMDVDAEGRITTIEYMAEMTYGNALERVDIKNYGTAALPSDIASQVENLEPFVTPTSWEDENPDIASKLTRILGSDAASVPYVYVPSVHGKLEALIGGEMEDRVHICSNDIDDFDSTDFVDAYREAVIAAGYVLTIPAAGSQGDVYVKGNVAIEIGSQDYNGIYVYRYTAA